MAGLVDALTVLADLINIAYHAGAGCNAVAVAAERTFGTGDPLAGVVDTLSGETELAWRAAETVAVVFDTLPFVTDEATGAHDS
jgi:hypothetical protein